MSGRSKTRIIKAKILFIGKLSFLIAIKNKNGIHTQQTKVQLAAGSDAVK